ncbi:ribose transport system ATP-binding protein [Pararhizobium capsulatum DSM 1112]|uniref:Ribose transport system ATP-binding protein n=1 Tax=Pararhizobium capsulatum DSM 1112 TaxID=1121113 RepID=A0ABU0BYU5_9HYPH|nr:sugar ABC transporter ATP-binding protein [Pararhizobium capsulatum]MDQ0322610.1 ribose transport system ATP-binding protein [Pararhizobium capsulatum DSM 1112]
MTQSPLVQLTGITKTYGAVTALRDVDFSCSAGTIHAILGENGAGKSTLMKLLSGVISPSAGSMSLDGSPVAFSGTRQASQAGIVCMFQELSLMPSLTVGDNIVLSRPHTIAGFLSRKAYLEATACLARIGAGHIAPDRPVSELTLAERQLVEIAKALYQKPRLLILDEATSALGAEAVEKVFFVVRQLRDEGVCILFISHRFHEVHALADRISVFRNGGHVRTFSAGTIDHEGIVSLMIGQSLQQLFPPPRPAVPSTVEPLLSVRDMAWDSELDGISFDVRPGEIYGLGGLEGQGQQRVLEAIFGVLKGVEGTVEIAGKPFRNRTPFRAKAEESGIAFIPEDRKTEGMIPSLSIANNMRLAGLGRDRLFSGRDPDREEHYKALLHRLDLVYGSIDDPVSSLSGGNQQKVLLAKWLALKPRCILLLDPTRGIDVKTKAQIYQLLSDLADAGMAIVLQSTDYEELIHLCNRVAVFYHGRIARELAGASLTPENLISAAMGLSSSPDHHPMEARA